MPAPLNETAGSFDRFITALEEHGSRFATRRTHKVKAQCPAHDDGEPSLTADYKPGDRKTMVCCQAGCATEDVLTAIGLTLADLFDDPMPEDRKRRSWIPRARTVRRPASARTDDAPKKPKRPVCTGRYVEVARYRYEDVDGQLAGVKVRRECSGCTVCQAEDAKPGKKIMWERPAGDPRCDCETCAKVADKSVELHMPEAAPLYRAARLAAAADGATVYLCEGEKAAEAAEAYGELATTKPGSASSKWNPDHTLLLAGKHVVIVADRDTPGYRCARESRDALLDDAASVTVVHTPVDAKGADLADHRDAGLPLDGLTAVPADLLDPDPVEDLPEAHTPAPGPADWAAGEPIPGDDGRPNARDEYAIRHGEIVRVTRKRIAGTEPAKYETAFETVLGCVATIVRVETRDVGDADSDDPFRTVLDDVDQADDVIEQRPTTGYVLELVHPKALDRPVLMRVSRKAYDEGSWLHDLPWPNVYYKRTRAALAQVSTAISAVSPPDCQRVPVFAATGWRRTPAGQWMYVHADGGITPVGHVALRTRFPGRLSLMGLPKPSTDPDRIRLAALNALSIPTRTPEYAAVALMGLAFRAPFYRCPSSILVFGLPGSGKTGLTTLVQRFYAPRMDRTETILSISDTGSTQLGTAELLYRLKDTLIMGDDSAPDRSVRDAAVRTSRMARSQYNGEGRVRLKQVDGEQDLDDQRGPRGSLVQTAETLASTESAQQRTLTIQMVRSEIDVDQLAAMSTTEFGQHCGLLTASYIQWIAADYEKHCTTVRHLANDYAAQLRAYCGDRPAEHLGHFATGWHMMLRFLQEIGAFSAEEAEVCWEMAWSALLDACDREQTLLENNTMHKRLLSYLATAFSGRHAHLVGPNGKCPTDQATAMRYGWSIQDNSAEDPTSPDSRPVLRAQGVQLGVVALVPREDDPGKLEERLWLDHQQATRLALRMAAELSEAFTVTANVLTEALRQAGVIAVERENTKNGRWVKPRRPMPGGRMRVWDMPASALDLNEPDDDGSSDSTGQPRPPVPPAPQADPLFDLSALTLPQASADAPAEPPETDAPQASVEPSAPPVATTADVDVETTPATVPATPPAPAEPAASIPPQPAPVRPRPVPQAPEGSWRAAVAVADVDGLHLPDGTVLDLPPADELHAGTLAQLVADLKLGHGGSKRGSGKSAQWRPDPGMIYIQDALAQALGLPDPDAQDQDDEDDEDTDYAARDGRADLAEHSGHPFLARARAEGWTVEKFGTPTRIYREHPDGSSSSAMIEVTGWARTTAWGRHKGVEWLQDNPPADVLAHRAQQIADTVGITYRHSAGSTGHDLLKAMRPERGGRAAPLVRTQMPPILSKTSKLYSGRAWARGLKARPGLAPITEAERNKRYVLVYDTRAAYLSVCGSLRLGKGQLTHLTGPDAAFDRTLPGYWVTTLPKWDTAGWFDVYGPRRDGQARPYVTPTLAHAQDQGIEFEVTEAWVWRDHDQTLEPWYKHLRDALKAMPDDVDPYVRAATKATYTASVGLFSSGKLAGTKTREASLMYRPDISDFVMAAQQVSLTRRVMAVGEQTGMWPLGCMTDSLFYATDDPHFASAVPLPMGPNLGHLKPHSAALMSDVLDHLAESPRNTIFHAPLYTSADEWEASR